MPGGPIIRCIAAVGDSITQSLLSMLRHLGIKEWMACIVQGHRCG